MAYEAEVIIVQTETLMAIKDGCQVSVYQKKQDKPNHYTYLGTGLWAGGIIFGSGINCGVLAHIEPQLRNS